MKIKIGVIGCGYVGEAVSTVFKEKGACVYVYDKYKCIGDPMFLKDSGFVFICVPTPTINKRMDLSEVRNALDELNGFSGTVVLKSTVVPGTTRKLQAEYPHLRLVYNPEFLDKETRIHDFWCQENIIIGNTNYGAHALRLANLYTDFGFPTPFMLTCTEAEIVKYMVNAYYATRVIFANQFFDLCETLGENYERVRLAFENDRRVSPGHFQAIYKGRRGLYEDGCLLKDTQALQSEYPMPLLDTIIDINKEIRSE